MPSLAVALLLSFVFVHLHRAFLVLPYSYDEGGLHWPATRGICLARVSFLLSVFWLPFLPFVLTSHLLRANTKKKVKQESTPWLLLRKLLPAGEPPLRLPTTAANRTRRLFQGGGNAQPNGPNGATTGHSLVSCKPANLQASAASARRTPKNSKKRPKKRRGRAGQLNLIATLIPKFPHPPPIAHQFHQRAPKWLC